MTDRALERGRRVLKDLNPDLERILSEYYDDLLPEFSETLVEFAYGRLYARGVVDMKTRQLATVAALTALGGQTGPQLKVNIEHALKTGADGRELAEIIMQMSVYGGMPATINALNGLKEVLEQKRQDQ
ncbi:MAG: carboxymuconolactone decarboxylase family protein [Pseudomonadota bacterium]